MIGGLRLVCAPPQLRLRRRLLQEDPRWIIGINIPEKLAKHNLTNYTSLHPLDYKLTWQDMSLRQNMSLTHVSSSHQLEFGTLVRDPHETGGHWLVEIVDYIVSQRRSS